MPIRFSTQAANADRWSPDGDRQADASRQGAPQGPYDRPKRSPYSQGDKPAAGKPGQDINAAGFLKDPSPSHD